MRDIHLSIRYPWRSGIVLQCMNAIVELENLLRTIIGYSGQFTVSNLTDAGAIIDYQGFNTAQRYQSWIERKSDTLDLTNPDTFLDFNFVSLHISAIVFQTKRTRTKLRKIDIWLCLYNLEISPEQYDQIIERAASIFGKTNSESVFEIRKVKQG